MEIGINVISYFPWCLIFPGQVAKWARDAGYDFLQISPIRSIGVGYHPVLPVRYLENIWNDGNPLEFLKGKFAKNPLAPKPIDVVLFPGKTYAAAVYEKLQSRPGITTIVHSLEEYTLLKTSGKDVLLEVSPGLWKYPSEIVETAKYYKMFVVDTQHSRRDPRPDELLKRPPTILRSNSMLGDWRQLFKELLPRTKVIHVAPLRDNEEIFRFLSYQKTELAQMLRVIKDSGFRGDLVVETVLKEKGLNAKLLKDTMKYFRQRIAEIIE
ncbi:MAG: hypothetical protein M1338_04875 [Patescibacteria group bacterium]|nr:hypothetical protein [Patescibacteria group bacterium]